MIFSGLNPSFAKGAGGLGEIGVFRKGLLREVCCRFVLSNLSVFGKLTGYVIVSLTSKV